MDWTPVIVALITSGVTLAGAWLTFRSQSKSTIVEFQDQLAKDRKYWRDEYEELRNKYNKLELDNVDLKAKIAELELKVSEQFDHIAILEAYYEHMPGPAWMKDSSSRMFFINRAYENEWGVSKLKYEGMTDHDIWPPDVADAFVRNDVEVIERRAGFVTDEQVPARALEPISEANPTAAWRIWKFPVVIKGEVVGIGGIAVRKTQAIGGGDHS